MLMSLRLQLQKYMKLDQKGKVLAEYIWIDGSNGLRNKTKVSYCPNVPSSPNLGKLPQTTQVPHLTAKITAAVVVE
jgi:hypothetical protein